VEDPFEVSVDFSPDVFDQGFLDAAEDDGHVAEVFRSVMGDEYAGELAPFSLITRSVLTETVVTLDLSPGQILVDLACGTGGPGLWLARESGAKLIGIDWSSEAIRQASMRNAILAPAGGASFHVGLLTDTGLDDGSADAVVCYDAFQFARDPIECVSEIARILRTGGRFMMSGWNVIHSDESRTVDLASTVTAGGLVVDTYTVRPDLLAFEMAIFEAAARAESGKSRALDNLKEEAEGALHETRDIHRILLSAHKPHTRR
jgi:ubiquinone/menaquinone biosynthesis C-methylase UbiE